jgi:hypothetical protein
MVVSRAHSTTWIFNHVLSFGFKQCACLNISLSNNIEREQLFLDEIAFQFCFRKRSKTDDLDQRNFKGVKELFNLSVASAFFFALFFLVTCVCVEKGKKSGICEGVAKGTLCLSL